MANILPGQRIRIIISYVETLKYEDGTYKWSFPMVVAPRYVPDTSEVTDASRISPPSAPGVRAGHDISLEIDLDAGVPIVGVNSDSHETEVQQINEQRAVVRLKDRATIPNKDFMLTYRVAGPAINDAVLTHRSERGGFFTLILQPPQRVAAEDVMPKELVFVLDTSGSMNGFPLEKARETMKLALNNLYPHDTFNLITFAGETKILFPEPVLATPENLRQAKKFLADHKSEGGTEMMKAIRAALEPSDSQQHVRIVCFMTDGHVYNDEEILAAVKKYSNARIFAMGFSDAPNRYLLDKMAEYGRGEVDYVSETGDTSAAAQQFNERVRNPLLTDISIDWSGLPISDVYPKRVPDLFGAKPLILSGRYNGSGKGVIRLKGKLAGQDFLREIPVELPERQTEHDVLATLWARRRIDDLTSEQPGQNEKQEEITRLGLDFKLMTQYTSFVAIDEVVFTGTEDPKRVDVPVYPPGISATVMVTGEAANSTSSTLGNTITTRLVQDLPIQGRSFATLLTLAPGIVDPSTNSTTNTFQDRYGVANGQRSSSNSFVVDGVSANFALTANGGANSLAALGSIQEVKIQTIANEPEHLRVARTPSTSALFPIEIKDKHGYIDSSGKIVIRPQFDDAWSFSEGLAPVRVSDKWGFIDKTGTIVIAPQFFQVMPFKEGLACVGAFFKSGPINDVVGNYGYIDHTGRFAIAPQFGVAFGFSNGLARIQTEDYKKGYIDKSGKVVFWEKRLTEDFSDNLALFKTNSNMPDSRTGYLDLTGHEAIAPTFDWGEPFSGGLACVSQNEKSGFIDSSRRR